MRRALLCLVLVATVLVPASTPATAASPFEWRGIIEGPYGRPWTAGERDRMLEWMAGHGLNAYVHAPKDDLYGRTYWRAPYPPGEQAAFNREIAAATRDRIAWIPNISPALPAIPTPRPPGAGLPSRDLCFQCPSDLAAVRSKFAPFVGAGARVVMVSFDDVAKTLTHAEDIAAYGQGDEAFGRANGSFLTRLAASYRGRGVRLLTVGADYSGTADTAYLKGLRATLDRSVEVMWTGTNIPSEDWRAADARAYGERIGRRPLVWDNWTNTDTTGSIFGSLSEERTVRIFLGPYRRRPEVAGAVGGFFFNVANEADLNKLPLATAAAFLDHPRRYEPRRAWLAAVRRLAGARLVDDLRAWAETNWSNRLDRTTEAPSFTALARATLHAYGSGGAWTAPHAHLRRELALVRLGPMKLAGLPDRNLARQAGPFIDAAARAAHAGDGAALLLASERPALSVRKRADGGFAGSAAPPDPEAARRARGDLASARAAFQSDPRFTYGWRGGTAFDVPPYAVPNNVMSDYLDRVEALDREFQPRSAQASASVAVAVGGRTVPLGRDGSFSLPASACGQAVEAVDGSGGRTAVALPACRPACFPRRVRVKRRRVGALRVGRPARAPRTRRVCGGGRVRLVVRRGRIAAIVTTAPGHRSGRLRPGGRAPRHGLRRVASVRGLRRSRRGVLVLVRGRRVRALAAAGGRVRPRVIARAFRAAGR
ncbi:MAG: beta-N-acetylglucosaminidase domain-containing protein [Solirubrobacteraceae bacterium]